MYACACGANDRSTDEARNSKTIFRASFTRSEFVWMSIPASTFREQAGTSVRAPVSSTTHTRHTLTGVRVSKKHNVGVSMPFERQASRMVIVSGTRSDSPSILISISHDGGSSRADGGRLGLGGGVSQIESAGVMSRMTL